MAAEPRVFRRVQGDMIAALIALELVVSQSPNSPPEQSTAEAVASIEAVPLAPLVSLLSPTGRQLALGTQNGGVWILDLPSKRFVSKLQGPNGFRVDMSWSQDGASLAVLGDKGEVLVADASTGVTRATFTPHFEGQPSWTTHTIEFAANGQVIVALHGGMAEVVRASDGEHLYSWKTTAQQHVTDIVVSRDGARVAMGTVTGEVIVWDATSGARIDSFTLVPSNPDRTRGINDLAFDPQGRRLAIGADDCAGWLWTPGVSRPTATLSLCDEDTFDENGIGCVQFSSDGERVLATVTGTLLARVWQVETGSELQTFDNGGGDAGTLPAWFTSDSKDIVLSYGCLVSPESAPWISYTDRTRDVRTWWQSNGDIAWAEVGGNLVVRNVRNPEPILRIPVAPYRFPAKDAGGK